MSRITTSQKKWFLAATALAAAPGPGAAIHRADAARIANAARATRGLNADAQAARTGAPTNGTIFALHPDIPPVRQRVWFERADSGARLAWRLDGKPYGHGARAAWLPWPGRHVLELVDARGQAVDTVSFEVRGAFARTAPRASR